MGPKWGAAALHPLGQTKQQVGGLRPGGGRTASASIFKHLKYWYIYRL